MKALLVIGALAFVGPMKAQFYVEINSVSKVDGRLLIDATLAEKAPDGEEKELAHRKELLPEKVGRLPGKDDLSVEIAAAYRLGKRLAVRTKVFDSARGEGRGAITFYLDEEQASGLLAALSEYDSMPFPVHETERIDNDEE